MIDTLFRHLPSTGPEVIRQAISLPEIYGVCTLHRPSNVDDAEALASLTKALHAVADWLPMVLPIHPRGREGMQAAGLFDHPSITVLDPLGYIQFLSLVRGSVLVITDSGGIQEETTMLGIPCLTLRPNTERPITITHGTNMLTTAVALPDVVADVLAAPRPVDAYQTPPLWDGASGERIAAVLAAFLHPS